MNNGTRNSGTYENNTFRKRMKTKKAPKRNHGQRNDYFNPNEQEGEPMQGYVPRKSKRDQTLYEDVMHPNNHPNSKGHTYDYNDSGYEQNQRRPPYRKGGEKYHNNNNNMDNARRYMNSKDEYSQRQLSGFNVGQGGDNDYMLNHQENQIAPPTEEYSRGGYEHKREKKKGSKKKEPYVKTYTNNSNKPSRNNEKYPFPSYWDNSFRKQKIAFRAKHYECRVTAGEFSSYQWKTNSLYFARQQQEDTFENFYTMEECDKLIAKKMAFRGDIQFKDNTPFLGIIKSDAFVKKIYVKNYDINRAVNGCDVIFVPITQNYEKYLTGQYSDLNKSQLELEEQQEMSEEEDLALQSNSAIRNSKQSPNKILAKVVYIETNPLNSRNIVVKIKKDYQYGSLGFYIYDGRYPNFTLKKEDHTKFQEQLYNYYFLAKYDSWKATDRYPSIKLMSPIGEVGNIHVECECLVKQFNIPARPYPQTEIDHIKGKLQLRENDELVIDDEIVSKRSDLRKSFICTIDPKTAKDLDDALSIELLEDGNYEVGVHIADVSHFVEHGTYIDLEAQKRSVSYYFPHKVFPMLPEILCDNLCSLNPGVDRLAFSIFFKLTPDGERVDEKPRLEKSIIHSACKLSYEAAKEIIEGAVTNSDDFDHEAYPIDSAFDFETLMEKVLTLNEVAQKRRAHRKEEGSIQFQNLEKKRFIMNESNSKPIDWHWEDKSEANEMVEEYMLLANIYVAELLYESFPTLAVLRRHEQPNFAVLDEIKKVYRAVGDLELRMSTNQEISESIESISFSDHLHSVQKSYLHHSIMKMLKRAEYFVTCQNPIEMFHHFALNFPFYTHFTSPIRRYPDLIVHRMLTWMLEGKKTPDIPYKEDTLINCCRNSNLNKKNGKSASKKADQIFYLILLRDQPITTKSLVVDISASKLIIFIEEIFDIKFINLKCYNVKGIDNTSFLIKYRPKADKKTRRYNEDNQNYIDLVVKVKLYFLTLLEIRFNRRNHQGIKSISN